jgi:hypothetical protein
MRLSPFRRPRKYVRLAAFLAIGYAAWLLLVPITVDYKLVGERVTVEGTHISWWTDAFTLIGPDFDDPTSDEIVAYVYVDCGNSFTAGDSEQDSTAGRESCSSVDTPRRIFGIGLAVLGLAGLFAAPKVPAERLTSKDRAEERRLLED